MSEPEILWPGGPRFIQAKHFRLGTDCVLLADFVNTAGAQRGIELGCASGAAMLLLLERSPRLHMTGLEIVPGAASLARENMALNDLTERGEIITGDIRDHRALFRTGSFDLLVCNPPYFPQGSGALPQNADRAAARSELLCTLPELCAAAAFLLQTGGRASFVHRPERLSELLVCNPPYFPQGSGALPQDADRAAARSELLCTLPELCAAAAFLLRTGGRASFVHRPERLSGLLVSLTAAGLEPKRLRLVCRDSQAAPSLVLVEARRGGKPGLTLEPSLYLQNPDGSESDEYKHIYHRI